MTGPEYFAALAGPPELDKPVTLRLLLTALYEAVAAVTGMDAKDVEYRIHDYFGAGPCPACLLTGAGDPAAPNGITAGAEVAR